MAYYRRNRSPESNRLTAIALIIIGILMLFYGIVQHSEYTRLKNNCTQSVNGTVTYVDTKRVRSGGRHAHYHTEYKATIDIDEGSGFGRSSITSSWSRSSYTNNTRVTVKYDPKDSSNYYVSGHFTDKGIGTLIAAGICLVCGTVYMLSYLRRR